MKVGERNRDLGDLGEAYASKILDELGFILFETEYETQSGEIDIIAFKNNVLHFIEVKTSDISSSFRPEKHLDLNKRYKYPLMAKNYLNRLKRECLFDIDDISVSYDLFAITVDTEKELILNHKFYGNYFHNIKDRHV